MRRAAYLLAVLGGLLVGPLLCDFGVTAHDCVCESTECCAEEVACEFDTCDDGYKTEDWRRQHLVVVSVATISMLDSPVSTGAWIAPECASALYPYRNQPFPDSDLPLRI